MDLFACPNAWLCLSYSYIAFKRFLTGRPPLLSWWKSIPNRWNSDFCKRTLYVFALFSKRTLYVFALRKEIENRKACLAPKRAFEVELEPAFYLYLSPTYLPTRFGYPKRHNSTEFPTSVVEWRGLELAGRKTYNMGRSSLFLKGKQLPLSESQGSRAKEKLIVYHGMGFFMHAWLLLRFKGLICWDRIVLNQILDRRKTNALRYNTSEFRISC